MRNVSRKTSCTEDFKNENIRALRETPTDAVEIEHELQVNNTTQHNNNHEHNNAVTY